MLLSNRQDAEYKHEEVCSLIVNQKVRYKVVEDEFIQTSWAPLELSILNTFIH